MTGTWQINEIAFHEIAEWIPTSTPTAISRISISDSVKFGHVDFHPPSRYLFSGIRANPAVSILCRPLLFFPTIPPEKQGAERIPAQFR
jgi:hypothetical protein